MSAPYDYEKIWSEYEKKNDVRRTYLEESVEVKPEPGFACYRLAEMPKGETHCEEVKPKVKSRALTNRKKSKKKKLKSEPSPPQQDDAFPTHIKVYVNMCQSALVEECGVVTKPLKGAEAGKGAVEQLRVPMSCGALRLWHPDEEKKGGTKNAGTPSSPPNRELVMVCDVIFHPKTLTACADNDDMRRFVCDLAVQRVAEKNSMALVADSEVQIVPDLKFFWELVPQRIRKPKKAFVEEIDDCGSGRESKTPNSLKHGEAKDGAHMRLKEQKTTRSRPNCPRDSALRDCGQKEATPKHSLVVIGDKNGGKEIEVEVTLPKLTKLSDLAVDISDVDLTVSDVNHTYQLTVKFPSRVDSDNARALFKTNRSVLKVSIPIRGAASSDSSPRNTLAPQGNTICSPFPKVSKVSTRTPAKSDGLELGELSCSLLETY